MNGASLPFGKFFWSDYASDPALKVSSFAAQGLWMRLLCIAAEHDPIGYVAVNGKGLDANGIARIAGGSSEEVLILLDELEGNGVFSRDRRGWIYSRRMIRDAKKARNARENGKKGGNPKLSKQKENAQQDNRSVNGEDKPHIPEARDQSSEDKSSDGEGPSDPVKELFDLGVSILTQAGETDKRARSLIGKWRKVRKDGEVLTALLECRNQAISSPTEWLSKRLDKARYVSGSGYEYRGSVDDVIREAERRADWNTYWRAKGDRDGRSGRRKVSAA